MGNHEVKHVCYVMNALTLTVPFRGKAEKKNIEEIY